MHNRVLSTSLPGPQWDCTGVFTCSVILADGARRRQTLGTLGTLETDSPVRDNAVRRIHTL